MFFKVSGNEEVDLLQVKVAYGFLPNPELRDYSFHAISLCSVFSLY